MKWDKIKGMDMIMNYLRSNLKKLLINTNFDPSYNASINALYDPKCETVIFHFENFIIVVAVD